MPRSHAAQACGGWSGGTVGTVVVRGVWAAIAANHLIERRLLRLLCGTPPALHLRQEVRRDRRRLCLTTHQLCLKRRQSVFLSGGADYRRETGQGALLCRIV